MPSSKQLAANRRNAQKSTGPRTADGKARASQNALKTGLYAETILIGPERAADFDALAAEFTAEYHPTTPTVRSLVDQLIHCEWMLRRLRRIEREVWKLADAAVSDHFRAISSEGRAYTHDQHAALDRLYRQRAAIARTQRQTLLELRRLCDTQADPPTDPPPQPIDAKTTSIENGFVPSKPILPAAIATPSALPNASACDPPRNHI
jgi:hypothetical protein